MPVAGNPVDWARYTERAVGIDSPVYSDVVNRPLRSIVSLSGYSPDGPFYGLPTGVQIYNAAAFAGASSPAKITAAVAQAVTDGAGYVFVPATMLPYDTDLVTTNAAVTIIHEGQQTANRAFYNPQSSKPQTLLAHDGAKSAFLAPPLAPPANEATHGPIDIIAHWYTDFGINHDSVTGGGSIVWYDWSWNWNGSLLDTAQRTPTLGWYKGDHANVLDWQCHWLRQAGITGVSLVSTAIDTTTWTNSTNVYYWIYQLMTNAPNFRGLSYMLWGAYSGTLVAITAAWTDMISNIYLQYRNFYCVRQNGKLYPVVYVFEGGTLHTNIGGTEATALTFFGIMRDLFKAAGYGGIAIFARHPKSDTSLSRATLELNDILYFAADYAGHGGWLNTGGTGSLPIVSDAVTYAAMRASWAPLHEKAAWVVTTAYNPDDVVTRNNWIYVCKASNTSSTSDIPGEGKNQSTYWTALGPICREVVAVPTSKYAVSPHPSAGGTYWKAQTPSPEQFRQWLARVLDSVQHYGCAPAVMIYNVSEWAEGGPGLQGNSQDKFGFLEAAQQVLSGRAKDRTQTAIVQPVVTDTVQPLFIVAASTIPSAYDRVRLSVDADRTLTATPTITAGRNGQRLTLFNETAFRIVLQDNAVLAGSTLYLNDGTFILEQKDAITLEYDTTIGGWCEISKTTGTRFASVTLGSGNNNNLTAPLGRTWRVTTNAAGSTLTGIIAGTKGQRYRLINTAGGLLTIAHESGSSTGVNRIFLPNSTSMSFPLGAMVDIEYDDTAGGTGRWRVLTTRDPPVFTLTDASTITTDAGLANAFVVTVSGNRVMAAPTNPRNGQRLAYIVIQNATGGYALTWNAVFKQAWVDTGNTASKRTSIAYIYDGTNWCQDGAQSPYL